MEFVIGFEQCVERRCGSGPLRKRRRDLRYHAAESLSDVAFPDLVDEPISFLELSPLAGVALAIELELSSPELRIGSGQVRMALRAVVPIATVDEDRDPSTGVGDVWPPRCPFPVQPIARKASLTKSVAQRSLGLRVACPVGLHHGTNGRGRWRRVRQLQSGHDRSMRWVGLPAHTHSRAHDDRESSIRGDRASGPVP